MPAKQPRSSKLVTLKTREIEFLDEETIAMGMSLWDTMMSIKHPSNPQFSLSIQLTNIGKTIVTLSCA